MCLHISFHSELHRVERGLAKQAEVKGQEAPGEEVKGQRPPKSTYFELAISPVCGLQESLWDTSQGLKLTSSAKASRLLVSMV